MPLTRNQLEDHVEIVWGADNDGRLDAVEVINQAGRHLFDMHSWGWRVRPAVTLGFSANQGYVLLPADFGFGEVVEVVMNESTFYTATRKSLAEVEELRSDPISPNTLLYCWAVAYPNQESTSDAPPQARLEFYPIPSSADVDALKVVYRAGWMEMVNDDSIANIPENFSALLLRLVRAYAGEWLPADVAITKKLLTIDQVEGSAMVQRLKQADGAVNTNLGRISGGQIERDYNIDYRWNFDTDSMYSA